MVVWPAGTTRGGQGRFLTHTGRQVVSLRACNVRYVCVFVLIPACRHQRAYLRRRAYPDFSICRSSSSSLSFPSSSLESSVSSLSTSKSSFFGPPRRNTDADAGMITLSMLHNVRVMRSLQFSKRGPPLTPEVVGFGSEPMPVDPKAKHSLYERCNLSLRKPVSVPVKAVKRA